MSPPDKLQHLWLDNSNTGQKLSSQVPPNLSEIEMIFTVLSSDLSKKWLTSLKKKIKSLCTLVKMDFVLVQALCSSLSLVSYKHTQRAHQLP